MLTFSYKYSSRFHCRSIEVQNFQSSAFLSTSHGSYWIYSMLYAGLIHYQLVINLSQSLIRTNETLPFPKKLVFRGGKKAFEDRQALLQFLVIYLIVRITIEPARENFNQGLNENQFTLNNRP